MRNYDIERALYGDVEPPVIRLDDVCKDYADDVHALKHLNLVVNKGEFVFLIGSSGSGKSTFIKLLLKEIPATSGKIYVMGRDISRLKKNDIARHRRNIGIVFQDFRLLPEMTVFENVAFAMRVVETPMQKIRTEVPKILSIMGSSTTMISLPSTLDPRNSWEIMRLLDDINKKGTTVIVVTHNKEIVDMMQKRVVHLNRGVLTNDYEKGGYLNAKI